MKKEPAPVPSRSGSGSATHGGCVKGVTKEEGWARAWAKLPEYGSPDWASESRLVGLPVRYRVPGHTDETNRAVLAVDGDGAAALWCPRRHCLGLPLPTAGPSPLGRFYLTSLAPRALSAAI